jgi:hypothetical protein
MRHPLQSIEIDEKGILRFVENRIVRFLLNDGPFDLNQIARMPFCREDREQFAQLIGYSLSGFSELDYVSDEACDMAFQVGAEIANTGRED